MKRIVAIIANANVKCQYQCQCQCHMPNTKCQMPKSMQNADANAIAKCRCQMPMLVPNAKCQCQCQMSMPNSSSIVSSISEMQTQASSALLSPSLAADLATLSSSNLEIFDKRKFLISKKDYELLNKVNANGLQKNYLSFLEKN